MPINTTTLAGKGPSVLSATPAAVTNGSQLLSGLASSTPDVGNTPIHPTFFGQGGTGRKIAGFIGDMLYGLGGGDPVALHAAMRRSDMEQQQSLLDNQLKQLQIGALTRKAGQPQTQQVGDAFGIVNPDTGGFDPTYIAPTDAERYAMSLGYPRGSADYMKALEDFTLHGNGPTAFGQDQQMERLRQQGRVSLEGVRQGNRTTLKALPTYGQTHPRVPGGLPGMPGGSGLAGVSTGNLISQLGG